MTTAPGKNFESDKGFPTPDSLPEDLGCRAFQLPNDADWYGLLMGALQRLREPGEYYQWGSLTPDETAAAWDEFIWNAYENACGVGSLVPTPFWDEVTETDDQFEPDEQPWYGYVLDPDLPPDELTFVESAGIWAFTGLLAVSGTPAAAILFHTVAPSFVLAMRGDDFAQVIRILVDAHDQATVETTGDPDELFEIPLVGDPDSESHDVLIILRELL